ncbi:MAG: sigma-70 family RNA polymerase sigma factor [Acidimicrobiia bacterium]|nr:MAG: sigma-70 family RNA polymerase sigma factor [Acidimicrobiia bacterium]
MTLPEQTDIQRSLIRDLDEGFSSLVKVYQPGIYSGAVRLTGHMQDAQDIAQDTFVRAYRALDRYDERQISTLQFRPWLWTIALNLCRNKATRTKQLSPLPSDDTVGFIDPEPFDVDVWRTRLDRLTQTQRTAVVLRFIVGLPVKEVAAVTGKPQGTVKADVSRGLDKLRNVLAQENAVHVDIAGRQ